MNSQVHNPVSSLPLYLPELPLPHIVPLPVLPLLQLLNEKGDEIFCQADSVVLEVDLDKEIVKGTLALARKHKVKTFALVANMSIAAERRDLLQQFDCVICNQQEAGILFLDDYEDKTPEEMREILQERIAAANIPAMVVTMGGKGAVYADRDGNHGYCPARNVQVKDTTGAGDAFCAGVAIGLTYGKSLPQAIDIGSTLAASVIISSGTPLAPGISPPYWLHLSTNSGSIIPI